jgi:hypothetical protein
LTWNVNHATALVINPEPGSVQGSSVNIYPNSTTTYELIAENSANMAKAMVTVAVQSGSSDWDVRETPPSLSNPVIVDMTTANTSWLDAYDIHCGGLIYKVDIPDNRDAIVHMSGNKELKYPVQINGGRNVRVVGLQLKMVTQPGCGVGELPNRPIEQHPNANVHPRIPGAISLRVRQSGATFIEGLYIDVMGHQADCIVSRNPDSMTDAQAQSQRDVTIQNTACRGVEGMGASSIGDGVHGDLFQNQGRDIMRRLVFENVSHRTSQEGIVIHGGNPGFRGTKKLIVRRYDYSWDARFVGDDNYEKFGLALAGVPGDDWTLENVRIDDYRDNGDYLKINDQRYGQSTSSNVQAHPEIRSGLPPEGAFALPERTGLKYVSPHGNVPGN